MKRITTLTIACLFASMTFAQDLYVSPQGNDASAGDVSHPLATLNTAIQKARSTSGATIHMAEGTYSMLSTLKLTQQDSNIKLVGAGMGKTILSSGISLPPFQAGTDGIWRVDLTTTFPAGVDFQQLYVGGKRATLARTPNENQYFTTPQSEEDFIGKGYEGGLQVSKMPLSPEMKEALKNVSLKPSNMKAEFFHKWDVSIRPVWSLSESRDTLYYVGNKQYKYLLITECSQFILEDDPAFLDAPGEWYYDRNTKVLSYIPREGETIQDSQAVIPTASQMITIQGTPDQHAQNISMEGITLQYTSHTDSWRGKDPSQGAAITNATLTVDYADGVKLKDCEITHTGNNAIWFCEGCRDCEMTHCYLHDLGIGAVKIGTMGKPQNEERDLTRRITIDNNILSGGSRVQAPGEGVLIFNASDCNITHNEIQDFYYTGISVGWTWGYAPSPCKRNNISYNHIHHIGWGLLSDMGGIYTLGLSEGTMVTHNVIHDIYSYGYGGWGLYTDEGSTQITLENNLVYHCKSSGFHQHYGQENIIRNNLFVGQINEQLAATRTEDHLSFTFSNNIIWYQTGNMYSHGWKEVHFDADKNLYWHDGQDVSFNGLTLQEWQKETGKDLHSIIADPGLADDFRLTNKKALRKIGYKPFDWHQAGVYGDESWQQKAQIDPQRAALFDETVKKYREAAK